MVCTDLSGKEVYIVGVGRVMSSGSLGGVMVSTLAQNAREGGFDSSSKHNISHFHHHQNTGACD